jgi:hypothetical protein
MFAIMCSVCTIICNSLFDSADAQCHVNFSVKSQLTFYNIVTNLSYCC